MERPPPAPRLSAARLAGFPVGYGLVGALVGGTLNRVMVAEMGLPVSLVGFLFALPLLEAPLRVWLGYRSDGYPILGRRREPYIVAGALLALSYRLRVEASRASLEARTLATS
jgi:BCD family chlorophyll transporter-like MFS transporter